MAKKNASGPPDSIPVVVVKYCEPEPLYILAVQYVFEWFLFSRLVDGLTWFVKGVWS